MQSIRKQKRIAVLAHHRRENVFSGYSGIGDYHSGAYECDFVSPYTKSAGNVDADIMLVLQDWCSDEYLRQKKRADSDLVRLGHDPQLEANKNLKSLLFTHFGIGLEKTYATNLFPFIKPGTMNASVRFADLKKAAEIYTVPEIEIVAPRLVVCLGAVVYRAIRKTCGLPPAGTGARVSPDPAEDVSHACLPMIFWQTGRLPQHDSSSTRVTHAFRG